MYNVYVTLGKISPEDDAKSSKGIKEANILSASPFRGAV